MTGVGVRKAVRAVHRRPPILHEWQGRLVKQNRRTDAFDVTLHVHPTFQLFLKLASNVSTRGMVALLCCCWSFREVLVTWAVPGYAYTGPCTVMSRTAMRSSKVMVQLPALLEIVTRLVSRPFSEQLVPPLAC